MSRLRRRARMAYELGRVRAAASCSAVLSPLALWMLVTEAGSLPALFGFGWLVLAAIASWYRSSCGAALLAGLPAGLAASLPLLVCASERGPMCRAACALGFVLGAAIVAFAAQGRSVRFSITSVLHAASVRMLAAWL